MEPTSFGDKGLAHVRDRTATIRVTRTIARLNAVRTIPSNVFIGMKGALKFILFGNVTFFFRSSSCCCSVFKLKSKQNQTVTIKLPTIEKRPWINDWFFKFLTFSFRVCSERIYFVCIFSQFFFVWLLNRVHLSTFPSLFFWCKVCNTFCYIWKKRAFETRVVYKMCKTFFSLEKIVCGP